MFTIALLENSTGLSIAESWDRTCSVMVDRPLPGAYWKLEEKTGENFLYEMPPLLVISSQLSKTRN
jgi:hypothetical protein